MTGSVFPVAVDGLVATLAALFREQRDAETADLLLSAIPRIELTGYDGWNGGTDLYTLFLEVPVDRYAAVEPRLDAVESSIASKATKAARVPGAWLSSVEITPTLSGSATLTRSDNSAGDHLWAPKTLRLFLSHVSAHKIEVAQLKANLKDFGISSFVAHEDIQPSRAWQDEILKAIRSMNAMAALLTPDFHSSNWTDQEVGMAIGRGALMLPINLGMGPYGFMATNQAMRGDLANADQLALDIALVLAASPSTAPVMAEATTAALEESPSYMASKRVTDVIERVPTFSEDQLRRLEDAIANNAQVSQSFYAPDRVRRVVSRHRPP